MRLSSCQGSAQTGPRSVRTLVQDSRVIDWGFHDITIVDMEDVSAPAVSDTDLAYPASATVANVHHGQFDMDAD